MHKISRNLIMLLLLGILTVSVLCLSACVSRQVVVLQKNQVIKKLPDGNYEVTPAWLQSRYRLERWQKAQLKKCK